MNEKTIERLVMEVSDCLDGYDNADVFSTLITLLTDLGYNSGISKRAFIAFVVNGVDDAYAAYEKGAQE